MDNNKDKDELFLRPKYLKEFVGQKNLKDNLSVFINAAKQRNESLDHILLFGPPGLGKTTLANIVANELDRNIVTISGPSVERSGDLVAVLSNLNEGDVLFIDEIHRISKSSEEILYSAMEDYKVDVVVGKDSEARTLNIDIPPFTLVGATTKPGNISSPLRDRFGYVYQFEMYSIEDIEQIVKRTSKVFETSIDKDAVKEIAKRSRFTPRIANRYFKRVRDYAQVNNNGSINKAVTLEAFKNLGVDEMGLDSFDKKYLSCIIDRFNGGPVGIDTISTAINEDVNTIEDIIEPYLIQIGFVNRTKQGREVSRTCKEHLKKA